MQSPNATAHLLLFLVSVSRFRIHSNTVSWSFSASSFLRSVPVPFHLYIVANGLETAVASRVTKMAITRL